jgi:hypothetical protein
MQFRGAKACKGTAPPILPVSGDFQRRAVLQLWQDFSADASGKCFHDYVETSESEHGIAREFILKTTTPARTRASA